MEAHLQELRTLVPTGGQKDYSPFKIAAITYLDRACLFQVLTPDSLHWLSLSAAPWTNEQTYNGFKGFHLISLYQFNFLLIIPNTSLSLQFHFFT